MQRQPTPGAAVTHLVGSGITPDLLTSLAERGPGAGRGP